jgi:hypothetical protein
MDHMSPSTAFDFVTHTFSLTRLVSYFQLYSYPQQHVEEELFARRLQEQFVGNRQEQVAQARRVALSQRSAEDIRYETALTEVTTLLGDHAQQLSPKMIQALAKWKINGV